MKGQRHDPGRMTARQLRNVRRGLTADGKPGPATAAHYRRAAEQAAYCPAGGQAPPTQCLDVAVPGCRVVKAYRPAGLDRMVLLVDRGPGFACPYVTWIRFPSGDLQWGHYYRDLETALADWSERVALEDSLPRPTPAP